MNVANKHRRGRGLVLTQEQLLERRKKVKRADEQDPIIVLPEGNEAALINATKHLCCECIHFDLKAGQQAIFDQKFWTRMMREEKYRQEWFEHFEGYGFCRIIGEHRAKPHNSRCTLCAGDLDSSLAGTAAGGKPVACPHFTERKVKGDTMSISRSHTRGLEH
jgi:hypothetical protein